MDSNFKYQCTNCGTEFPAHKTIYLCPDCSVDNNSNNPPKGVLKLNYLISNPIDFRQLKQNLGWIYYPFVA